MDTEIELRAQQRWQVAEDLVGRDMSSPWATPIRATPSVPATVHELPITRPTTAQIRHAAG